MERLSRWVNCYSSTQQLFFIGDHNITKFIFSIPNPFHIHPQDGEVESSRFHSQDYNVDFANGGRHRFRKSSRYQVRLGIRESALIKSSGYHLALYRSYCVFWGRGFDMIYGFKESWKNILLLAYSGFS
ncbi:hypothetical protein RHGRI_004341 [Rhododendron griersonianum]|uniref:Maturase K n=1 Tax=Rhododendron griersonianum TaxID=479676 RepID=A0AAV6L8A0_9ERIC|nr:hypothetical protein RHGRI_004341 [Rhododendron griersonianum]